MKVRLLVATTNRGNLDEFRRLLSLAEVELVSPADVGGLPEIAEVGVTFEANALLKARGGFSATGLPTLADDSGIEVDALGGEPGVYSARYAAMHGAGAGDEANNRRLLSEMAGRADRTARFRCVLAFVDGEQEHLVHGRCEGAVAEDPRGDGGFGYDPLFLLPEGRTMAELSGGERSEMSHRGRAIRAMVPWLEREWLGSKGNTRSRGS